MTGRDAGEEFDSTLEEIVQMVNRLQVRRLAFEEIDVRDQGEILGVLKLWRDQFQGHIERIDARLSEILDHKLEETS